MTMNRDTDLLMDKWHKTPNAIIDSIVGTHISASAGWIVMTVIRHTDGFGRDSTAIPTSVFMRVLGTERAKTAYNSINEAIDSGLITVVKKNGKVSEYSINKKRPIWYGVDELKESKPVAQNATTQPVAKSATSGEKAHKPVAQNATATSGEKRHTYKDNNKDNLNTKDIKEKNKKENSPKTQSSKSENFNPLNFEIPSYVNPELWKSYHEMRKAKGKKLIATENACQLIIKDFEAWHENGLDVNESLEKSIKSSWTGVFEPKRRINQSQNLNQGFNHANHQPSNQPQQFDTSTTFGYASKLTADAQAYYAQQAAQQRTDGSNPVDVHCMESTF